MGAPRYETVRVYAPFHRVANPRTQGAAEMRAILQSGELWGSPPGSSLIPAVKAYFGSLPAGQSGFEFFSVAPPDRPWGGVVY